MNRAFAFYFKLSITCEIPFSLGIEVQISATGTSKLNGGLVEIGCLVDLRIAFVENS